MSPQNSVHQHDLRVLAMGTRTDVQAWERLNDMRQLDGWRSRS